MERMQTRFLLFCHACGAGNTPSATHCFACNKLLLSEGEPSPAHLPLSGQVMLSVLAQAPSPGPGSLVHGRYLIERQIGQGGFGVVYLARDCKQINRPVAIKQINIGKLGTREIIDATDTFNREVTLLGRLAHKQLPRILDHFTDAEHWYLVMSYIKGQTLENYLQTQPDHRLPVKEVIKIGLQVCEVLHYLHTRQPPIIFRDIKPANLMRTSKGKIYLIDFGIARRYAPERTKDTGPLGSPGYAAPEQYGLSQTTALTDIYGLGATLQTLLTGKEPQEDQATDLPFPPAQRSRCVRLRRLLDQMLEKERSKRPENIEAVRARLENIQHGDRWSGWSYVKGLLWSTVPYALVIGLGVFFALSYGGPWPFFTPIPASPYQWPVIITLAFLGWTPCLGPLLFFVQFFTGCTLLSSPRARLVGLGLLSGLALVVLFVWAMGTLGEQAAEFFLWPFIIGGD